MQKVITGICVAFCLIGSPTRTIALVSSDSLSAEKLFEKGIELKTLKKHKESLEYFQKASVLFEKTGQLERYITSQHNLAWVKCYVLNEYAEVIRLLDDLTAKAQRSAQLTKIYLLLSVVNSRSGNHEKAVEILHMSIPLIDQATEEGKEVLGNHYNLLSIQHWYLSQFDSTIFYGKSNITVLKSMSIQNNLSIGNCYGNLGLAYWQMGKAHLALEYIFEAQRLFLSQDSTSGFIGYAHMNIGSIYADLNAYEDAISYSKKAINFFNRTNTRRDFNDAILYHTIGESYLNIFEYDSARFYTNRALKLKLRIQGENHYLTASTYSTLGRIYLEEKNYNEAFSFLDRALNIGKRTLVGNDPKLISYYNLMSHYYVVNGQDQLALAYADSAIDINHLVQNRDQIEPSLNNMKTEKGYLQSLIFKAQVFEGNGQEDKAIGVYNNIISCYDTMAFSSIQLDERYFFRESSRNVSNVLMNMLQLDTTNEAKNARTFDLSEKNKSALLRFSMNDVRLKNSLVPEEIVSVEHDIDQRLTTLKSDLQKAFQEEEKEGSVISDLERQIFSTLRERELLVVDIEKNYPEYYDLKFNTTTASVSVVQNEILEGDQSLVEYFIGDSSIYVFVISKSDFKIKRLPIPNGLEDMIAQLPGYLKVEDLENYADVSHKLYNALVRPLNLNSEKLIIVPDGILWHLNFGILLSETSVDLDFRTLPYLLKQHQVSYAYSATIFLQDQALKKNDLRTNECLAFSYNSPQDTLTGNAIEISEFRSTPRGTLPGTQAEVSAVSDVLNGAYYYGSFANERNFKTKAKDYNVLHLALHGELDDNDPMNSKLIFSQSPDSLEDNYLYAFELYDIELNADLAVLSACNTGGGKIKKGEGLMSLGRAFSYAGCKSLVISQWELSDKITPQIIKSFYQNLQDGQRKSEALRNAKLTYLEKADNPSSNPYYWASLIQLGNDEPINKTSHVLWVTIALALSVFSVVYWQQKQG